jgi:hypothetical protein
MAEATLIGELVAGTSTITATAPNGAAGRIQVRIRPAAPASLALNVSPQTIGVGGQVATLTTTVRDPYGNAVADGTAVEFSTDLGELRAGQIANSKWQMADGRWQMADGEWQIADSKWQGAGDLVLATVTLTLTTTSGTAVAGLVSGPVAGTAHVRVAVAPNLLQTAEVSIRPGGPMTVTLTANPPRVLVGGRVQLVATVTDGYGNPVADGTVVRFAVNRGRLDQTEVGTLAGVASTWFTADRQPGSISAVAISGYASGFGTVEVEMVRRYVPLMIR